MQQGIVFFGAEFASPPWTGRSGMTKLKAVNASRMFLN